MFTGRFEELEKVSACKLVRQLAKLLAPEVNDSDFSFISLEDDEFFPDEPLPPTLASTDNFLEDFSSDFSFI